MTAPLDLRADRPLDVLLHYWPKVIAAARPGWDRDFALSIQKQRHKRGWTPTARQMGVMQDMVRDLFRRPDDGGQADDLELIERE